MLIQLAGLVFAVTSTWSAYNVPEGSFSTNITMSSSISDYDKNPLFSDTNSNSLSINHPSDVYEPTQYSWNISYDYLIGGATYHFDLGSISLIFEYSNFQYGYSITPSIYISCDNSDYEFTYYNILPIYTLTCSSNYQSFNFTKVVYDTQYCSLATQYSYSVTIPTISIIPSVDYFVNSVNLQVELVSLSEVDFTDNYNDGYNDGYNNGKDYGYNNGYDVGYSKGNSTGYQNGFNTARAEYENQDAVVSSIFDGILGIGLLPVEFLMSIFNFEILGINFTHIVSALLSLMILVILLRIVLGGKGGEK